MLSLDTVIKVFKATLYGLARAGKFSGAGIQVISCKVNVGTG